MGARADLLRTAGNVFLTPISLSQEARRKAWRRALMVGPAREEAFERAERELREAVPDITTATVGRGEASSGGVPAVRRSAHDVVCLLLTGEGGRREKLLALLSRADTILACGRRGDWYRVDVPAIRLSSLRWWARLLLAGLLSAAYLAVMAAIRAADLLWRVGPAPRPVADPGPAAGLTATFIVPSYNQRHLMDFCLPPLLAEAGQEHKVMLVDDASTDGGAQYVRDRYPSVRVLRLPRNRGFVGAVRAGIGASRTPLFALINTDVEVRPGFLRAMSAHFERTDTFAVCSQIELPGGSQMETGNVAAAFSGILEPHHVPAAQPGFILYAGGASSLFHRARYEALGGFETIYRPLYWEDIDLGYRAWRRGWRSVFEPAASVFHKRRAWMGARFGDRYSDETFLKNALVFVWKNVRDRGLLAQNTVYVWARLVREVLAGESMMCRALLRALPLFPCALAKRWRERRRGDLEDRDILALAQPVLEDSPDGAAER